MEKGLEGLLRGARRRSSCGGILELRRGSEPSPWVGPGLKLYLQHWHIYIFIIKLELCLVSFSGTDGDFQG